MEDILEDVVEVGVEMIADALKEELEKKRGKKKIWSRNWIKRRKLLGASDNLIEELALEDPREYRVMMRMSRDCFMELLNMVEPAIKKKDTIMRDALSAKLKLEVTLYYLATGNSLRSIAHLFRVPQSSMSKFLPEVLQAIYNALRDNIKVPNTEDQWTEIEERFSVLWNFPKCCGAIDGKHVVLKKPANTVAEYHNYKGTYSIVLFALVDADYCFRYINVGANGRANDSSIFQDSELNQAMENKSLNMPPGAVIVADDAFPLRTDIMKPFSRSSKKLSLKENVFNYRLSRARRVVENAFGILVNRFRVFSKPIELQLNTVDKIIMATCALHNWLRVKSPTYLTSTSVDQEDLNTGKVIDGTWRKEIIALQSVCQQGSNNYKQAAERIRCNYATYFCNEGSLPFQWRAVGLDSAPESSTIN